MERDTIKFFRSYRDAAKTLAQIDPTAAYEYLMAILDYGFDGALPTCEGTPYALFLLVKPTMDAYTKKQEAGAKGGSKAVGNRSAAPCASSPREFSSRDSETTTQENASTMQATPEHTTSTLEPHCEHPSDCFPNSAKNAESKTLPEVGSRKKEVGCRRVDVGSKEEGSKDVGEKEVPSASKRVSSLASPPPAAPTHTQGSADSPFSPFGFSPTVDAKLRQWFTYKSQRGEGYTPQGKQALLSQLSRQLQSYPESAVCALIDECMASSWKSIVFERLPKNPAAYPGAPQPNPARRPLDADEQAAIRRMFGGDSHGNL